MSAGSTTAASRRATASSPDSSRVRSGDPLFEQPVGGGLLGDVPHHPEHVRPPAEGQLDAAHLNLEDPAVLGHIAAPRPELVPVLDGVGEVGEQRVVAGMDELGGQRADQLVALVAVHPAQRGVDLHDPAGGQVGDDQAVRDRLEDRPVLLRHLRGRFARPAPCSCAITLTVPSRRALMHASATRLRHLSHPPASDDRHKDRPERRCASPPPAPIMKRPGESGRTRSPSRVVSPDRR